MWARLRNVVRSLRYNARVREKLGSLEILGNPTNPPIRTADVFLLGWDEYPDNFAVGVEWRNKFVYNHLFRIPGVVPYDSISEDEVKQMVEGDIIDRPVLRMTLAKHEQTELIELLKKAISRSNSPFKN